MLRLVLSCALVLLADVAAARPSSLSMSCAQAHALVASQGAVVLSTGQFTYERYVGTPGYCLVGEIAEGGFAPTRDTPQCHVGWVCKSRSRFTRDD